MRCLLLFALVCLTVPLRAADSGPRTFLLPDPEREGRELAERLRTSVPTQNSEIKGTLIITGPDGDVTEVPITSSITLGPTNWHVVYRAAAQGSTPAETLTIVHAPDRSNDYKLAIETNTASAVAQSLSVEQLHRPFAGSDFWALDLGLEFLHWPKQRKLKHEMRRSRACHVLESVNPAPVPGGYARVLSWVDVDTSGIIRAEAYDTDDKLVKQFILGSLAKVDGQWQVRDIRIASRKTGQETELKYDLQRRSDKPPTP